MDAVSSAEPPGDGADRGSGQLAEELRRLLDAVIDRAASPAAAPAPPDAGGAGDEHRGPDCGWCPVCALVGALRGERPELARRLGEHGAGLAATLRALVEDHEHPVADPGPGPATGSSPAPGPPRVQRIPVRVTTGGET